MFSRRVFAGLLALAPLAQHVAAQGAPTPYTDPDTGIIFSSWTAPQGMKYGFSLPGNALEVNADEFIGFLECNGNGWCGHSYGGSMQNNLLMMAYPHGDEVYTAFQWASGFEQPVPYEGEATLTQISHSVTEDGFRLVYRCQGCLSWSHEGTTGGVSTSAGGWVFGWALASTPPTNADCPRDALVVQHESQLIFGAAITEGAVHDEYEEWAALATEVVTGDCEGEGPDPPTSTTTALPTGTAIPVPDNAVYDYVVVGSGAGGIPVADRLSEAGHKVLLIEKGPPSSGRWGGTMKPQWLEGTNLTRFDVPGLCNQIWVDSAGIACRDTDQMAGCVLGGGTAVNAALWWKPNPKDWDYNFPSGWKASDVKTATDRVFNRIPGTLVPSSDGEIYLREAYDALSDGLESAGWKSHDPFKDPGSKSKSFTHTPYMYQHGERDGPMATYLVSANARDNFDMWTNTQVNRLVRTGGHVTGLEVSQYAGDGYRGTVKLTPGSGRVILSAGTFGSAKILLRSGIGPEDQLDVVAASTIDGPTMIEEKDWILLPVGENLEDHTNTDTVVTHPNAVFYDFYEAFNDPPADDEEAYLDRRAGILTQSAPNIGPVFFDEITGADGITRQLQWTARVEGSLGVTNLTAITMSQYLGRGAVSRGRMTINSGLNTVVSTHPYLRNKDDVEAVIKGIENVQKALAGVEGLEWQQPPEGVSAREYVEGMLVSPANRRANHWIGTAKLSTKDGRNNGDGVVDLNTKVYGTDNLFVVDASIFPGMVTSNPSSYIVVAAEHAAAKILALTPAAAAKSWEQCGGREWTGTFQCASGLKCTIQNPYYHQCLPTS